MKWFPVFQNMRQALINWYHYNLMLLALPSWPHLPGFGWDPQHSEAHLARLDPAQMDTSCSWLAQSWEGSRHQENWQWKLLWAGNALTHNILETASAGHKIKWMFEKSEYSDPESSEHLGSLDILALDWLVHTAWSRKEEEKKKQEATSNLFF